MINDKFYTLFVKQMKYFFKLIFYFTDNSIVLLRELPWPSGYEL